MARVIAIVLSLTMLSATVARSAVVGLLACAGAHALSNPRSKSRVAGFILIVLAMAGLALMMANLEHGVGSRAIGRWMELQRAREDVGNPLSSTGLRVQLWRDAWNQFRESPIFGSDVVERNVRGYPHNLFLETLMSTGLVGGACMAFLLWRTMRGVFWLLRHGGEHRWVGMLFIQSLSLLMFSSTLFLDSYFWFWMAAVAAIADPSVTAPARPRGLRAGLRPGFRGVPLPPHSAAPDAGGVAPPRQA
jgi:O-antigen ligase